MEFKVFMFVFVTTLLVVCIELCETSDRTCIKQLNSFKVEVRDNMSSMNTGIETLFKGFEEIKTALLSSRQTSTQNLHGGSSLESKGISANFFSEKRENITMVETCVLTNVDIINLLKSERQLNRKLETRVQAVEDAIFRMTKNMDTLHAFMDYINDTLKERTAARPIDKDADLIHNGSMNGDGDKGVGTSSTVGVTSSTVEATAAGVVVTTTAAETDTVAETTRRICEDTKGVFGIYLKSLRIEKSIYCDTDTDGGDWVVIMRRQDGSVDFDRKWKDYKNGFGNVDGEFWIGNDVLHELTKYKPMELRIDMEDYRGNKAFANYKRFQVGSEAEKYVLTVTGYSGTAGDSLDKVEHPGGIHHGHKFSTIDSDNDVYGRENCAETYPGGWWFNMCFRSHLTGIYGSRVNGLYKGILWHTWLGWYDYLKYVDMKIR